MKIGFSEQQIPIDKPYYLAGFTRADKTDVVQLPLEISTMALQFEKERMLICILDSVLVDQAFCNEVKKQLFISMQLRKSNIIIAATHTHSAPAFLKMNLPFPEYDDDYRKLMMDMILTSAQQAFQDIEEVRCSISSNEIYGVYGNRNLDQGPTYPKLDLLKFYHNDTLKGIFVNMACHPTINNQSSNEISSDLIGGIRQKLRHQYHVPITISNGACGDISTRFFRKGTGLFEIMRCSEEVITQIQGHEKAINLDSFFVKHVQLQSYLNVEEDPIARQTLSTLLQEKDGPNANTFMLENMLFRKEIKTFYHELDAYIYRLHDLYILTIPGELVSYFARIITQEFPNEHILIIAYANDYVCYLVDEQDYGKFFESKLAETPKGKADELVSMLIKEIHQLKEVELR